MKEKMTKLMTVFAFAATIGIANLSPLTASAAADTCTWTGTASSDWSDGSNWTGCDNGSVPENNDALVFPVSASNKVMNNDIPALQTGNITINGTGYTIGGTDFTIAATTAIIANESAIISAGITYDAFNINIYAAAGKTLAINGVTNFDSSGGEVNVGSSIYTGIVDFTGNITGTAASQFIAQDGARAIVRGGANTFTASTVGSETGGVYECRSSNCFGDTANDIYMGGGTVELRVSATYTNELITSTSTPDDSILAAYDDISITGNGSINDDLEIDQRNPNKGIQFTGATTLNGSIDVFGNNTTSDIKFDGALSGAGGVTVNSGDAWMSGSHTFNGTVIIKNGAVAEIDQINSLGSTVGGTIVEDGGALVTVTDPPGDVTLAAEPIQITGEGSGAYTGAIYNESTDDFTIPGNITLSGNSTVRNPVPGSTVALTGIISGTGDLTLEGEWDSLSGGYIEISGASPNTYNGKTIIPGGTIYFEKTGAIPGDLDVVNADDSLNRTHAYFYNSSNVMSDTGVLTMGSEDYNHVTFGDNNEVIGGLQGLNGTVQVQTGGDKVIIDQDFNSTYAGSFYTDGGAATFEKRGTGNLTLTGDSAFIDDEITFTVSEGILTINGDVRTNGGGDVQVNGGTFKGVGVVRNLNTAGGVLAPGNSPGKLTVSSLTLDSSNVLEAELDGPVAGTSYDQIESSGAVNLANATLNIKPSYTPSASQVFTIITGSSVTGTFKNMPNNSTIIADGITFRINYGSTSVTLTYVSGTYNPNGNDSLANTGTSMLLAALASIMLIATATVLASRRPRSQPAHSA